MKRTLRQIILICSLLGPVLTVNGQKLNFEHLTVKDGLSKNSVLDIVQDNFGFMWFATGYGLNRYDGSRFSLYINNPADKRSISDNYINALFFDSRKVLWAGTSEGLNSYEPITDKFKRIDLAPKKGMAWGVNNGLISHKKYEPVISRAWGALSTAVHPDGKLGFVQPQGAAPDKVGYEDTDVFGVGAFLLAGSEVFRLNLMNEKNAVISEVYNLSSVNKEQTVRIGWNQIKRKIKVSDPKQLIARDAATGKIVPLKINYERKKPVALQIVVDVTAGSSRFFEVSTK